MQNSRFMKLWIRSSSLSWKDISHWECIDWGLKDVKGFLGGLLDAALFCSRSYPSWCRFHSLHFQPVVLHGRIGGIFWWVGLLLVTKNELARCRWKRQGCTKNATVLVFVLSSPLVKYQWLRGRSEIHGQNISMLNPHTFTAGLTCFVEDRCSLFLRRHSHCWGGTSEREQSWGRNLSKRETTKKSKKEIKMGNH